MKLFISHSWKDKNAAHFIAEALEPYAELWLDVRHLNPGDAIQSNIDAAIAAMDVVMVLWSKDAAASDGVDAEIRTAVRLGTRLLPVQLDDTPLAAHPGLAGVYGIRFDAADPTAGLFRIQAALARTMLGALDLDSARALNDLTTFNGLYQYVEGYRNRQQLGGPDSTEWALRSMQQCQQTFESLSALRDEVGDTLQVMQDVMARVQEAGDDATVLQGLLQEVLQHPRSHTRELTMLATFIEGKLKSLRSERPRSSLRADAPASGAAFARQVGAAEPASAMRGMTDGGRRPDPAAEALEAYVRAAPAALQHFIALAGRSGSPALAQAANTLHAYLENPHDLIPDDRHGIFGFLDDAWLIHNTIYRCIEAGLFGADLVPVDWAAVVRADALVVRNLPPQVRAALERILLQSLQAIAQEVAYYQPQFAPVQDTASYGAYMGGGAAVGGAASGPQSVDDLYVGGGGWVEWPGKNW